MGEGKVAIYGAGSLGTVLGAFMTQNGVDVELVNRNKAHVEALREKGAHITGTVEMTVPVKAIYPDEMEGTYEVIFLMTKQLFNAEVVTFLKPMLTEDGVIVTLQNGIPEPGIAEIVGKAHTMGCTVEWGATLSAPGECTLTSDKEIEEKNLSVRRRSGGDMGSMEESEFTAMALRETAEKVIW